VGRGRLEAFSDGVFAIIITIMVLELRPPEETDWHAVGALAPQFFAYVLSFVYVGIYWNNHHHLVAHVKRVTAAVMWGNLGLLFWLTLLPFVTAWAGENSLAPVPMVVYGLVLFMSGLSYFILQTIIVVQNGGWESPLGRALGRDYKGRLSLVIYAVAIAFAWVATWISFALFVVVALIWLIPDRRLERALAEIRESEGAGESVDAD
jgi:uncharacterized membrane protein